MQNISYFSDIAYKPIKEKIQEREKFCSLDPGERIFQTFYGEKSCGTIGNMVREKIIKINNSIRKLLRILKSKKNKKGKRLKHSKKYYSE